MVCWLGLEVSRWQEISYDGEARVWTGWFGSRPVYSGAVGEVLFVFEKVAEG